jgi:hypothetical protein
MDAEAKKMLLANGASNSLMGHVRSHLRLSWVGNEPYFHALDDNNNPITIAAFFSKLKADPKYANQFAEGPQRISQYDTTKLRTAFDQIRSGEFVVVDDTDLSIR